VKNKITTPPQYVDAKAANFGLFQLSTFCISKFVNRHFEILITIMLERSMLRNYTGTRTGSAHLYDAFMTYYLNATH
jgi:hypothetical protein